MVYSFSLDLKLNHVLITSFYQKNIEIENAEEADFLKNKLCGVLRDFNAKKQENTMVCATTRVDIYT